MQAVLYPIVVVLHVIAFWLHCWQLETLATIKKKWIKATTCTFSSYGVLNHIFNELLKSNAIYEYRNCFDRFSIANCNTGTRRTYNLTFYFKYVQKRL